MNTLYLVAGAAGFILVGFGLAFVITRQNFEVILRNTIAAVYRVAISTAAGFGDDGIRWLRSDAGVAFRKNLAARAYDALPGNVGPVPIGIIKAFVSRERFIQLVDAAFAEIVDFADSLDGHLTEEGINDH